MKIRQGLSAFLYICAGTSIYSPAVAQPAASAAPAVAAPDGRFGIVRLRIDPGVGEQEADVRRLLARHSFVRIAEPADYLVTTRPDFPLDVMLVDLRDPPELWEMMDSNFQEIIPAPRSFPIGNLLDEQTEDRLARVLVGAARLRSVLDHSLNDMRGIDICLKVRTEGREECRSIDSSKGRRIVDIYDMPTLKVTNRSEADRYVAMVAADGSLELGALTQVDEPVITKLGPGETVDLQPMRALGNYPDDPRILLLVSSQRFSVGAMLQPAPLQRAEECAANGADASCRTPLPPIALNNDLAVRSFQLSIPDEPRPAMGNGSDVTARMAVWMAQFYSIVPYKPKEIEDDARLPEDERQFLRERSYEERAHRCGATLIAPNVVLTAAHCVAKGQFAGAGLSKIFKDRRVRLGTRKLGKEGQSFRIAGVAVHADYHPDRKDHDLALLLLEPDRGSGIVHANPIAIADRSLPGGTTANGFGWGFTGAVSPTGNIMMSIDRRIQNNPEVLQYGEMVSVSLNQCRRKLANRVAPGMVCMYSKEALSRGASGDGVFTCRGDSGGPLVRKVNGRDVLVGVVSWSMGCGYKNYPSVFTDAGSYARWIAAARASLKPGLAIRVPNPPPVQAAGRQSRQ